MQNCFWCLLMLKSQTGITMSLAEWLWFRYISSYATMLIHFGKEQGTIFAIFLFPRFLWCFRVNIKIISFTSKNTFLTVFFISLGWIFIFHYSLTSASKAYLFIFPLLWMSRWSIIWCVACVQFYQIKHMHTNVRQNIVDNNF